MIHAYGAWLAVVGGPWLETHGYKIGRADGPLFFVNTQRGRSPDRYCNHGFQPVENDLNPANKSMNKQLKFKPFWLKSFAGRFA